MRSNSARLGPLARLSALTEAPQIDPAVEHAKELKKFKKTKDAKSLVDFVRTQHTKAKQARSREVQQWNYNLAMYFGNQNIMIQGGSGPDSGKFFTPNGSPGNERLIINRIKPLVRTELARLLSQKPAASVVPATSDEDDMMAAMAGEQVWESLYSRRKYHTHFSHAAFWTVTTGTGFIKTCWDDTAYDRDSKMQGDIRYSSIQPYNLFVPDLLEQEIEDQYFVLEISTKSVEWVNFVYRDNLEKPAVGTTRAATSLLEDAYVSSRTSEATGFDSVLIYEMWVKPGAYRLMPQGGYVMIVGEEIVEYLGDGLPYEHGEYPYAKFEHVPTAKFYASSVIEDVISLQKEYNKIRSQIADNRRRMGNVQLNAYKGSILPERMTSAVGQINLIRPGMQMPTQVQPAQLPSYISENMDRALSDIEDISGQHQVSKGNVPPGITAATAISYLQERDDSLLTHTYQSVETGTEKVAGQSLGLAVQYWDEQRLIRTVGADNAFDTMLLSGAELAAGTDIRIESGSALPQSKAGKQSLIMDMMKFGWIEPDVGLKMMEIGGAQKIFEQIRSDERQAQRENVKLKSITEEDIQIQQDAWEQASAAQAPSTVDQVTQQPMDCPPVIPVNSFDNHQVHIDVHNRYRRGQAFEMLSDPIKAQFEAHVQMHKAMLMQEQAEQFMSMIPGDGTEGQPGMPATGPMPESAPPESEESPFGGGGAEEGMEALV